ncbi:uncharacterized protein LOC144921237 isoform X2 [Branchiostoma floridae x Branchiostoma belcheri]
MGSASAVQMASVTGNESMVFQTGDNAVIIVGDKNSVDARENQPPVERPGSASVPAMGRPNPIFTPCLHEDILSELHENFKADTPPVQALHGVAGVGKTELAIQYAERYNEEYPGGVFYLYAETAASIDTCMRLIFNRLRLDLQGKDKTSSQICGEVRRWLETHSDWLLVVDSCDDLAVLKMSFPAGLPKQGDVLMTSRENSCNLRRSNVHVTIKVGLLGEEESMLMLIKGTSRPMTNEEAKQQMIKLNEENSAEFKALKSLAVEFRGLPLALQQAVARIGCGTNKMTFQEYKKMFQERTSELKDALPPSDTQEDNLEVWLKSIQLDKHYPKLHELAGNDLRSLYNLKCVDLLRVGMDDEDVAIFQEELDTPSIEHLAQPNKHRGSVLTAYSLTVDTLPPAARALLRCISLLSSDKIPEHLFVGAARALPEGTLKSFLLPSPSVNSESGEIEDNVTSNLKVILKTLERCSLISPWPFHAVCSNGSQKRTAAARTFNIHPLYQDVIYWQMTVDEMTSCYLEILALQTKAFPTKEFFQDGDNFNKKFKSSHQLLIPHITKACEKLFKLEREMKLRVTQSADPHPLIAAVCSCFRRQGKAEMAKPMLEGSLALLMESDDTLQLAMVERELGQVLVEVEEDSEAEKMFAKSVEILREHKVTGETHDLELGKGIQCLARSMFLQEQHELTNSPRKDEIHTLLEEALNLKEQWMKAQGLSCHCELAVAYHSLGIFYQALELWSKADTLLRRSVEMKETFYKGIPHISLAISYTNLARNLVLQRKYGEALPLYQKAMDLKRQVLPDTHPSYIRGLAYMMGISEITDKKTDAENYEEELRLKPDTERFLQLRGDPSIFQVVPVGRTVWL